MCKVHVHLVVVRSVSGAKPFHEYSDQIWRLSFSVQCCQRVCSDCITYLPQKFNPQKIFCIYNWSRFYKIVITKTNKTTKKKNIFYHISITSGLKSASQSFGNWNGPSEQILIDTVTRNCSWGDADGHAGFLDFEYPSGWFECLGEDWFCKDNIWHTENEAVWPSILHKKLISKRGFNKLHSARKRG